MLTNKQQRKDRHRAVQTHAKDYQDHHQPPNQDTFPEGLSLFASVKDQIPLGFASLSEVADQVRTCPRIKAATEAILKDHREGILDGWKTIAKAGYQDQKTKTLPAVLPGGVINTRGTNQKRTITPSGYVGLDLDKNPMPELRAFADRVKKGKFANVAFCALSVSGRLNGSLALFMRVYMPTSWKSTPQAARKALGLNKNAPWTDNLNTINEAYHRAFSYLLKKNAGINAGNSGKSIYNVRYLAHDEGVYHTDRAKAFSLFELVAVLKELEGEDHEREAYQVAANITESDAFAFAEAFARAKGYELRDGEKHDYLNRFSIACNLLGVPREDVLAFADSKGIRVTTNCISGPYRSYKTSFGKWKHRLEQNKRQTIIEGGEGQKLTDVLSPEAALGKKVVAPTGSGKTWWSEKVPGRGIIVGPTLGLVDNVVTEYQAVPFTGSTRDAEAIREADFIATTYASFGKLCECLSGVQDQFNVFIDESHAFTSSTSTGYQLKDLTVVLKRAKEFKSFTLLTGTDLYNHHPELRALDKVIVKLPTKTKTFAYIDAKDTLKAAANKIKESVAAGRCPLVLFNNKSEEGKLGTLKTLLADTPGIRFFNSDTKEDSEFKQITSKGVIAEGITGLVTTSVLKEGNNIYNQYDFDVVVVGAFHASDIHQFSSRPRCPKSVHVSIVRSTRRKTAAANFDFVATCFWLEENTKKACNELNTSDGLQTNQHIQEYKARQAINSRPMYLDKETGKYCVDYLALSHEVFCMQRTAQTRNERLMIEALEGHGLTHQEGTTSSAQQSHQEKATAAEVRKAAQQRKAEDYLNVLEALDQEETPLGKVESELKTNAHNLTATEKTAYKRFERLAGVCTDQAAIIEQLKDIGPKRAKFEVLLKRLKIEALKRDKDYMKSNRLFAIVLKAIAKEFKKGDRLTSAQIVAKMNAVLSLDKSLDLSYLEQDIRSDRYLKIARLFFDLKRKDSRTAKGKKVNQYEVCPLTFDTLFNNTPKVRVQNSPSLNLSEVCF